MDLMLRRARVEDGCPLVDIAIGQGRIVAVGPSLAEGENQTIDCEGRVVIPGLIEPHLHLDKALLDKEKPNLEGTLAGAIAVTGELKRGFTKDTVRSRVRKVLDQAIGNGTTTIRAHPDVDPIIGLLGVEVLLELREHYRGLIDLQVVAFPQEGILKAPGTLEMLREALRLGADVVGGCTYNEVDVPSCERHVDLVFELAAEFGVPVDMHADFADDTSDPRFAMANYIAEATVRSGLSGRVALGHMTSLAGLPRPARLETMDRLAAAGVAVVALPATDMHLGGRGDGVNTRRGIVPVRDLWDSGVTCSYSSNNVRNAFTPYGNADPLDIGLFLAQTGHLSGHADLTRVLAMATTEAAAVIGISERYGIRVGADADLVVLSTKCVADALLDRPDRCFVIKGGRIVAETTRTTTIREPMHA